MSEQDLFPNGWRPTTRYPDPAVQSLDPAFDKYRLPLAGIERLATGMRWSEGPVWVGDAKDGYLLFSDLPRNSVMKWKEGIGASLFLKPSGYTGVTPYGNEPGCNGLFLDQKGRLHDEGFLLRLVGGGADRPGTWPDRQGAGTPHPAASVMQLSREALCCHTERGVERPGICRGGSPPRTRRRTPPPLRPRRRRSRIPEAVHRQRAPGLASGRPVSPPTSLNGLARKAGCG